MGLIGAAINDAIVVMAAVRDKRQAHKGSRPRCREVAIRSTRHTVATSSKTIGSFTLLLFGGGGFRPPLTVTFALAGIGDAWLDDVSVRVTNDGYNVTELPGRPGSISAQRSCHSTCVDGVGSRSTGRARAVKTIELQFGRALAKQVAHRFIPPASGTRPGRANSACNDLISTSPGITVCQRFA